MLNIPLAHCNRRKCEPNHHNANKLINKRRCGQERLQRPEEIRKKIAEGRQQRGKRQGCDEDPLFDVDFHSFDALFFLLSINLMLLCRLEVLTVWGLSGLTTLLCICGVTKLKD